MRKCQTKRSCMFAELLNFISGISLLLFVIHYLCYIVQSLSINSSTTITTTTTAVQQHQQQSTNHRDCIATDKQRENCVQKSTRTVAMQSEDAKYIKK